MILCIGSYNIVKKSLIKSISDYGYNTCGTTLLMPYLRCWVEVLRVRPRVPGSRATCHPYPPLPVYLGFHQGNRFKVGKMYEALTEMVFNRLL